MLYEVWDAASRTLTIEAHHSDPHPEARQVVLSFLPPEGSRPVSPHEELTAALVALLESGRRPTCANRGDLWLSDDPGQRTKAARACAGCPLTDPCAAVGDAEGFGVWAGIDRTPTRRRQARRPEPVVA